MQLAFILLGYFMGSLLFGYRITWLIKGVDIRELADDENPGDIQRICVWRLLVRES